ncbi:MAG: hypothetical protein VX464_11570 [Pseudomonadota bacterium]|nr:hypothetical protein [Pseudomonadota bacterium]
MNTISLSEVYGEDAIYVDDDSAAAIEGMPAAAWTALREACEDLTGGEDPGVDCRVSRTTETLDDFDASRSSYWSERGSRAVCEFDGRKALRFDCIQMRRGEQRHDCIVIDLGDCRAVLAL